MRPAPRRPLTGAAKRTHEAALAAGIPEKVLNLKGSGASFREIARQLEKPIASVHRWWMTEIKAAAARRAEMADYELDAMLLRLDRYLLRLQAGLTSKDNLEVARAVAAAIRIEQRRADLLGLDAPKKIEGDLLPTAAAVGTHVTIVFGADLSQWPAAPGERERAVIDVEPEEEPRG